ncbi:fatty acid hydroxylase domain-containing protein 2-like [Saccoglossus kowalevskii]
MDSWRNISLFLQQDLILSIWTPIYSLFNEDDRKTFLTTIVIVSFGCFWGLNGFFLFVDITGKPSFVLKYKIQRNKNVDLKDVYRALPLVTINQIVVTLPSFYAWFYAARWRGCSCGYDVPTLWEIGRDVAVAQLIQEFVFYYSHRLWHHPLFYKKIHKVHHEWTSPISITSVYLHPLEYFVSGVLAFIIGPLLMKSHLLTTLIWLYIALLLTNIHHCGYHLPLFPSPEFHDFHHLKFNTCYGAVLNIFDWIHGTDELFRQTKSYQRHKTFFSLTPLSESIPDK